ncbi:SCO family protein [Veronia pacifica]|uniref:Photosynthetic protein synthase I n=1 Tax=Veronia pacifica TaxID=1080227 RepID=A0A1C3EKL8_9GAMM|nr:SCO family protein [Veronia pacifica]ODA33773.1 photosynthetic protein synthase I [Veronia pacifica]
MKVKILILAIALIAGLGARYYIDGQDTKDALALGQLQSGDKMLDLYDQQDPRVRVVYFGYTHCPDVCPTSLAILSAAMKTLPQDTLQKIKPVFITLDPERDTGKVAEEYARHFHPNIAGASGPEDQIRKLAERYGVLFMVTQLEDSAMEYTVDHSSYFYFIASDGTLIEKVQHTLNPAIIADAIFRTTQNI